MKKLFVLIAVVVTLFAFAPTKAEAGPFFRHSSFHPYHGHAYRAPVRYYNNRYVRPVYYNQCQPRYTGVYRYHPGYRPAPYYHAGYRPAPYYNNGYRPAPYYNNGYYNTGYRGPSVSIQTRFGSFYIR